MTSNSVRQPDERQKAIRAMQLRVAGAPYRAIAESLDYADESGARKAVSRLLARTEAEGVNELRAVEGERLDHLQRAAWPAAIGGDLDSIKTVLAVIDRRMKLFGLAAPVRVDVGGVSHDEFARPVRRPDRGDAARSPPRRARRIAGRRWPRPARR